MGEAGSFDDLRDTIHYAAKPMALWPRVERA
jgi:hypothetical protein